VERDGNIARVGSPRDVGGAGLIGGHRCRRGQRRVRAVRAVRAVFLLESRGERCASFSRS
jgi:hypothetical protein